MESKQLFNIVNDLAWIKNVLLFFQAALSAQVKNANMSY